MKTTLKTESRYFPIIILPIIYLIIVWNELSNKVPIHWDVNGEIDRWTNKNTLVYIALFLPLFVYLLFFLIQRFSNTEKLEKMGKKFNSIKLILTLFISILTLFIIYASKQNAAIKPTFIFILIGLLITVLGNFFKTIQPNYFIGIRTPWTLKHDSVWKSTHELGGKLWFVGGLLIILLAVISGSTAVTFIQIGIIIIITIIPIVHSYLKAKQLKK